MVGVWIVPLLMSNFSDNKGPQIGKTGVHSSQSRAPWRSDLCSVPCGEYKS